MSYRALALLASLSLIGCDAGGTPPARDAGPGGGDFDAGPGGGDFDAGPPGPTRDAGPGSGMDSDGGCAASVPLEAEIVGDPPDMLLVVDISSSMLAPLDLFNPFGPNKWSVMRPALEQVVMRHERRINYGLEVFPLDSECGSSGLLVDPAPMTYSDIQRELGAHGPFAEAATPTHIALQEALTYYEGRPANPIGRYVLLATDGLPNCNPTVDDDGRAPSIAAIQALRAAGIDTYVLGFGGGFGTADAATLRDMAMAGGTGSHYSAMDAASLEMALDSIAAEVIVPSCTVELGGPPRDPALFRVELDGMVIPRNPSRTSGWDYDSATNTITLYGPECASVESGMVAEVSVDFGCPGPLI